MGFIINAQALICFVYSESVANHSHLVAGLPVIAVGHAYFKAGQLVTFSNNSGHYKSKPVEMVEGIRWLIGQVDKSLLFENHSEFNPLKHYYADTWHPRGVNTLLSCTNEAYDN